MSSNIKVMIVDDHDMVRVGLRTYISLEPGLEVVGEASNGQDAFDKLNQELSASFAGCYFDGSDHASSGWYRRDQVDLR